MNQPVRLQLRRTKGFSLQALSQKTNGLEAVNVARPGRWGNPFVVGQEHVRRKMMPGGAEQTVFVADNAHAVQMFKRFSAREIYTRIDVYRALRGKNLACWCAPNEPCHADVLLEIANR